MAGLLTSEAVTVGLPVTVNKTASVSVPLINAALFGSVAVVSLLVRVITSVTPGTMLKLASTALIVTFAMAPSASAPETGVGVPVYPDNVLGAFVWPGTAPAIARTGT